MTRPLRVLIGCEQSGVVRDAFNDLGHDAWSCDLLAAETPSNRHIVGDVRDVMYWDQWDILAVMHPPCTRLCNSGVRWLSVPPPGRTLPEMWAELDEGAELFSDVWNVEHIPHVAVENPVMHKHAKERIHNYQPPAQTFQPWQFATDPASADNVKKRTCLWLRDLPALTPTGTLDGTTARADVHNASPGPDRWKERSRFFPGVAAAMADQWARYATAALPQPKQLELF
ncbi:hypothetical protein GCM10011360_17630 [Primorskyibacter flagellatus]|uniref:DNA cytosine methyltransferase n=1 Tax=Primorskyibacter flagellatus TaxID=1387277 RepID=A0A917A876_9RHOB|nr:hypothetical protein [Primorskyibacter flagellatus]GGE30021.1 hypothetical protein GCM10011360_17630 [Primorskyibacter flagellatus]